MVAQDTEMADHYTGAEPNMDLQVSTTNISDVTTSDTDFPPTTLGSRKVLDAGISEGSQVSSAGNCNDATSNTKISPTVKGNTTPQDVDNPASNIPANACVSSSPPDENIKSSSMSSPTPIQECRSPSDDTAMNKRSQRKRNVRYPAAVDEAVSTAEAMHPLTEEERKSWKGWVELESDPAIFNFILRKYGVNGVKIQEVFSLEDEMLAFLPKPVYGLIFLFRYRDSDDVEEPEGLPVYPRNVWFANQTTNNACATVAMLNIVMNSPHVDLGATLSRFKEDTRRLKPAYRGKRLGEHDFIRSVHNSFFRRMENLDADLSLQNDFEKWERVKNKPQRKTTNNNRKSPDGDELAFHFIAYVPVDGVLWRLDGLQRQPLSLGEVGDNWIALARLSIEHRMAQYEEDGVQFNLLSVCKSPLQSIPLEAAVILRSLVVIEEILNELKPGWKNFASLSSLFGFDKISQSFGLTEEAIKETTLPQSSTKQIDMARDNIEVLMSLHQEAITELVRLQASCVEEEVTIQTENTDATKRTVDHTQIVFNAVQTLLEAGVMKEVVQGVGKGEGAD